MIVRGSIGRKLVHMAGSWLLIGLAVIVIHGAVPTVRDRFVQMRTQGGELWYSLDYAVNERPRKTGLMGRH